MKGNFSTNKRDLIKNKSLKGLSAIAFACLATLSFGVNQACASNYTPTLGDDSAYSFTEVGAAANNTISLPTYNKESGIVEAINYQLDINKTEYGSGVNSRPYNVSVLKDCNIDFTAKYTDTAAKAHVWGANHSNIDYSGNFVDLDVPYLYPDKDPDYAIGSAINVFKGQIGDISGLFVNNSVLVTSQLAWAGAVFLRSDKKIGGVSADFIHNSVYSQNNEADGGAVAVAGSTTVVPYMIGDFIGNSAKSINSGGYGGALYIANLNAQISKVSGNFVGNSAISENSVANGGAIEVYSGSYIPTITGDFIANYAQAKSNAEGGAIGVHSVSKVNEITGDFIVNYAESFSADAMGGAIYHEDKTIDSVKGIFINNYVKAYGEAKGGAIYTLSGVDSLKGDFIGNYAISETGVAQGGAIWTNSDLNFVADGEDMIFADNYTVSNGVKDDNAIYVGSADATLNFEFRNKADLILKDNIDGLVGYNVNIIGDGTNTFYMWNQMRGADVLITNVPTINTLDNLARTYEFNSFSLAGKSDMISEVDFKNNTMDRIFADSYDIVSGSFLNVEELKWLNEPTKDLTEILFAEDGLKDNVVFNGEDTLVTPIHIYDISYENRKDGGYFVFARGSAFGGAGGYNPTVLSSSVNSTVGALGNMNQTFTYSFQNSDNYMNIPHVERLAYKNRNKYAISPMANGKFSPLFSREEYGSVWVKPYATFESVNLDNGPKVSNISYGTLIGFDTGIETIGKGWDRAITGFVGYNGANQSYRGVDSIQNGGMLGGTMTLYKDNFFNATTLSVGASVANNQTMYGNEDYAMLMSGIANKSGYNIEIKDGKFIIQPSVLLAYTFVNTFDYTNAAGVRMENDPFHALQISPGVKFIGNFKGGWQPYFGVNMVWNIMGESNAYANGVRLPQMSIKPYVQYGIGVQKRIKHHFMAFGQAMVQNGGRNGVALTCGFRWAIGCEKCKRKHQKVEGVKRHSDENQTLTMVKTKSLNGEILKQVQDDRGKYIDNKTSSLDVGGVMPRAAEHKKIIKQMTPQQRYAMGAKPYNPARTATTSSTVIKYSK